MIKDNETVLRKTYAPCFWSRWKIQTYILTLIATIPILTWSSVSGNCR